MHRNDYHNNYLTIKKYVFLASLTCLLVCFSCTDSEVAIIAGMENKESISHPSESPKRWLLAHVDVETTGLLPGYHEMIDIGIVMTTLDGLIIDSLFLRIQPTHPERLSPGAKAVNAYDAARWNQLGALSPSAAVDSITSFHQRVAANKHVLMVAYNSHFDAAFFDHLFRSASKTWRELYYYFILDIPSMAWGLGLQDLNSTWIMDRYQIEDEPHLAEQHTGITGAMVNVRIYRALLQYRQDLVAAVPGN